MKKYKLKPQYGNILETILNNRNLTIEQANEILNLFGNLLNGTIKNYNEILQQKIAEEKEISEFRELFVKHYLNNNGEEEFKVLQAGMQKKQREK